jgi:hypothetical protein
MADIRPTRHLTTGLAGWEACTVAMAGCMEATEAWEDRC